MTEQICVCIVSSLSAYILQSTLESMVTPLTKQLLGWGQKENALFFVGVGITAVIGYLTVTVSTKSYQITWYFVIQLRNPFYVTIFFSVSWAMFQAANDTCHWGCYWIHNSYCNDFHFTSCWISVRIKHELSRITLGSSHIFPILIFCFF